MPTLSSSLPPIVLFDLDGTVLTFDGTSPGPGRTSFESAMRELHAVEGTTHEVRFGGGTDRGLARAVLRRAGATDDDAGIDRLIATYLVHLEALLRERKYRPVGEVARAVAELRARGAVVGVATGNVRDGARLKLASAGLAASFDLAFGGYGCDAELRAEIVRIAAERCAAGAGAGRAIVVVGDTKHDVSAGRAVGARVVGVAINAESRAELEAAGADVVVDACGDDLVRAILDAV